MTKVTVWSRLKDQEYKHNHIENGHSKDDKPKGQPHQTVSWDHGVWKREWFFLNENNQVGLGGLTLLEYQTLYQGSFEEVEED